MSAEEREPSKEGNRECFFIAPIGKPGSPERKRSDDVFKHVVAPVATEFGLTALRADQIEESGFITTQIVRKLLEARVVVADFWGHNPNVFYELAVRHYTGRPVVHLFFGEEIPFDVKSMRAIPLNHQDLDSAADARKSLSGQMKAAMGDGFVQHNPVADALQQQDLRAKGAPIEAIVADLIARVAELAREVEVLRRSDAASPLVALDFERDYSSGLPTPSLRRADLLTLTPEKLAEIVADLNVLRGRSRRTKKGKEDAP